MEGTKILRNSQIIILGICIAAATIVSSIILSQGFLKIMKFTREQITVTGSATKEIKSDYIVWQATFSRRKPDLLTAYTKLKEDLEKAKAYLASKNVNEKEVIISQVSTETVYKKNEKGNDTNDIQGYRLTQGIEIRSNEIDKIDAVSRESTELINHGIEFESKAPEYFYTKLVRCNINY